MPMFTYFMAAGATLLAFLVLSSYELPDVGSPIKTSQLVGLPKVEPRADQQPVMTTSNIAAEKESPATQTSNSVYAQETIAPKQQNVHLTRQRQSTSKDTRAPREHRVAAYSHDVMMSIH
jgi:phage-related minor tail protein